MSRSATCCSRATSSARARSATARRSSSGRHLSPGDTVELEIEGVGVLRNRFTAQTEQYPWWPEPRENPFEAVVLMRRPARRRPAAGRRGAAARSRPAHRHRPRRPGTLDHRQRRAVAARQRAGLRPRPGRARPVDRRPHPRLQRGQRRHGAGRDASRRSSPPAGGDLLRIADFPPDSALRRRRHRSALSPDRRRGDDHAAGRNGELEQRHFWFHKTPTLDYAIVPRGRDLGAARRGRDPHAPGDV